MKQARITPAALSAFSRGDMENFLVAATPGGIEAQEKAGQTTFVANATMPGPKHMLEQLGIKVGDPVDDLFYSATLPAGWKKRATDHSMWSELVDDKGRKRASIFYKAAFYDRNAHMHLERRYNVNAYLGCTKDGKPVSKDDYNPPYFAVVVEDCGSEIHRIGVVKRDAYTEKDEKEKVAMAWLDEKFPNWKDATAYWD